MRTLKIQSLPNAKQWVDRDTLMLHACFQILTDFIELEKGDNHCNYEAHKDFVDEVRRLYIWWKLRLNLVDSDRDNEMLERLIKIRESLWT